MISKHRAGILGMSACMEMGAPKIIAIFLGLFDVLQLEHQIGYVPESDSFQPQILLLVMPPISLRSPEP